ncbi:MAG: TerB family tellurite resistance protein, partial [Gemmatimonadaceae bacterium]
CALLLAMAHADQRLSRDERSVITRSLVTYFGVDERGAMALMAAAEREWEAATDEQAFAAQVRAGYDDDQCQVLADLLWDVASADGWIEDHEAMLVERTAQWLGVERG